MFIKYKSNGKGTSVPVAKIYSQKEHPIKNSMIDKDALWAIRKLQTSGAEAYVVGGAIRDLLLGNKPKDVDIATSASPRQVQKLFWNSRIIGKRFRIVHLFFNDKIIEVTTFRSDEENFEEGNNNIFGTIEQDAKRRDFSINSLYYNPANGQLLDFNDAYADFRKKVIRSLIPLSYSFSEDPVRMIRALKYHATTGFRLKWNTKRAIKKNAPNIVHCSTSRLTEEVSKILASGYSAEIFGYLSEYRILSYLLPAFSVYYRYPVVNASLKELDRLVRDAQDGNAVKPSRSEMLYYLIRPVLLIDCEEDLSAEEVMKDAFRQAKVLISPITPANYELEKAVQLVLMDYGITSSRPKKNVKGRAVQQRKRSRASKDKVKARKSRIVEPSISDVPIPSSAAEEHDM